MQADVVGGAQHRVDLVGRQVAVAERQHLFQQRLAVSHRTGRAAGEQFQRDVVGGGSFGVDDLTQSADDFVDFDGREIEPLAPRQHRDRQLFGVRRTEDEFDVLGRFFQRFQQRVEGRPGQHVDFVDDVDLVPRPARSHADVGSQRSDFVDAAVGRAVDLDHVDVFSRIDGLGNVGRVVGAGRRAGGIVERLGKDPRRAGLADSASSREQVRMTDAVGLDRVFQRSPDVFLADQFIESPRAIPPGDDNVVTVIGFGLRHTDRAYGRGLRTRANADGGERTWARIDVSLAHQGRPSHKATPLMAAPVKA